MKYKIIVIVSAIMIYSWTETMDERTITLRSTTAIPHIPTTPSNTKPTRAASTPSSTLSPTAPRSSTSPTNHSPIALLPASTPSPAPTAWPSENYVEMIINTYFTDLTNAFNKTLNDPADIQAITATMRLYPRTGALSSGTERNSRAFFCNDNADVCINNNLFGSYQQFRELIIDTAYYANININQQLKQCFNLLDLYIKKETAEYLGIALALSYQLLDALRIKPILTTTTPLIAQSHDNEKFSTAIISLKLKLKAFNDEIEKTGIIKKFINEPLNTIYYQSKQRFFATIRMIFLYNKIYQNHPQFILAKTIRNKSINENRKIFRDRASKINTFDNREQLKTITTMLNELIKQINEKIKADTDLSKKISLWKRFTSLFTKIFYNQSKKIDTLRVRQNKLTRIKAFFDDLLQPVPIPIRFNRQLFEQRQPMTSKAPASTQRHLPNIHTQTNAKRPAYHRLLNYDSDEK